MAVNPLSPILKPDLDTAEKVRHWAASPQPAIFQGQDLIPYTALLEQLNLQGYCFIGCQLAPTVQARALAAGCLIMPCIPGLPFDPFAPGLYSPAALYQGFDLRRPESYADCLDWRIYTSFINPQTRRLHPVDIDVMLARRIHDAAIAEALDDLLDLNARRRSVAIMGGHNVARGTALYAQVARLAYTLTQRGFLILTGGGPGLMEAANLGAYLNGFEQAELLLDQALAKLADAPLYTDTRWLSVAFDVGQMLGTAKFPERAMSVGIPTWFYGHEPPNIFATHVAKYFENSIREEGLLAAALGGVIFAPGNAGTVQEIFQDACQNYYRTYENQISPMILLGTHYWNPLLDDASEARAKPVWPLLQQLAREADFESHLLLTDDTEAILPFLLRHTVQTDLPIV